MRRSGCRAPQAASLRPRLRARVLRGARWWSRQVTLLPTRTACPCAAWRWQVATQGSAASCVKPPCQWHVLAQQSLRAMGRRIHTVLQVYLGCLLLFHPFTSTVSATQLLRCTITTQGAESSSPMAALKPRHGSLASLTQYASGVLGSLRSLLERVATGVPTNSVVHVSSTGSDDAGCTWFSRIHKPRQDLAQSDCT